MSVSRSPAPSSIDLSGVPARVAEAVAQVVTVCHEQFRSDPRPEAFKEAELRVRETMNALACELLGAVIEKRDDGASRIERDGQSWFRVAATPRTIMTSLGPLTYRRARYRSGASGSPARRPRAFASWRIVTPWEGGRSLYRLPEAVVKRGKLTPYRG